MASYTLSKAERLSSRKAIGKLFESGASVTANPLRMVWLRVEEAEPEMPPAQAMFSVSKRKFPRAVDRNRIKRLIRESYRLAKPTLFEQIPSDKRYWLAFLFTGNEMPGFAVIQKSLQEALDRWLRKINAPIRNTKA